MSTKFPREIEILTGNLEILTGNFPGNLEEHNFPHSQQEVKHKPVISQRTFLTIPRQFLEIFPLAPGNLITNFPQAMVLLKIKWR